MNKLSLFQCLPEVLGGSLRQAYCRLGLLCIFVCTFVLLTACSGEGGARVIKLRLAATTSTRDSGLLDILLPVFEKENNAKVELIAVGTGKAIKLGEAGDAEIVLVHSRKSEDAFMQAGYGIRREDVMWNEFLVLAPVDAGAEFKGLDAGAAFQKIAKTKKKFLSRGDDSGTHKREQMLWAKGGGLTKWRDYLESGRGMGASVIMADQMLAYILVDKGTFLNLKEKIDIRPLPLSNQDLRNPYGIMIAKVPDQSAAQLELAHKFLDFMISPKAQKLIRDYKIKEEALFHPLHLKEGK